MSTKLQIFDIVFEGDDVDIFRPGDVIQGFVLVVLSAEKKHIRGIRVSFKGKTKTEWTRYQSKHNNTYSWKEVFFHERFLVYGEDTDSDRSYILPAGEHKFPFRFRLPLGLPPELYCKYAKVSYVVKATIDRPWKFDHGAKRNFKIQPVVDLNIIPDVLHPLGDQFTSTEGCLCCESGPMTVEIHVDKRGYIVGEPIWISGSLDNQSSSDITCITCALTQTLTFFAKSGWSTDDKQIKEYITEIELDGCPSYQKKMIEPTPFRVPAVIPSAFESCPNIFLEYTLRMTAMIGSESPAGTLKLPIVIGTIAALHTSSRPAVNMAVTHQSEAKQPPPPSYDFAVSNVRDKSSPDMAGYRNGDRLCSNSTVPPDFTEAQRVLTDGYPVSTADVMVPDSTTYYDTSLGYGHPSADPWQTSYIREVPQEQTMNRPSRHVAEAFV